MPSVPDTPPRAWVCLDVGETLIDETRVWTTWARAVDVPPLTLHAAIGIALARGEDYDGAFALVGVDGWHSRARDVERAYGGFRPDDLYPDALGALAALRSAGYGVAVVGNQPAARHEQLRRIGVDVDVLAMSEAMGCEKPDAAFFRATLALLGHPPPEAVAYVGDRIDNDIVPAARAGMRAVWLRRGPWALVQRDHADAASLVVRSLDELVARLPAVLAP